MSNLREVISLMFEYYGKDLNSGVNLDMIDVYFKLLKDYDHKDISKIIINLLKKHKFMPKVSEILDEYNGNNNDEKLNAWSEFKLKAFDKWQNNILSDVFFTIKKRIGHHFIYNYRDIKDIERIRKEFMQLYDLYLAGKLKIEKNTSRIKVLESGKYLDAFKFDEKNEDIPRNKLSELLKKDLNKLKDI